MELKVNGTVDFMGRQIKIIEGGFGEDCKVVLARDIAIIHNLDLKDVNRNIKRLIEKCRIKENIHFIDLKESVTDSNPLFTELFDSEFLRKSANIFVLSERGYMSLIKYMDDESSWEIMDKFSDEYFNMRAVVKTSMSKVDMSILAIVNAKDTLEQALAIREFKSTIEQPLLEQIDKYSRFLCDDLGMLTKKELATKLDTSPQTIAKLFKQLGIYTNKTNEIQVSFLSKFPNVKLIKETISEFTNPKTNKLESRKDWQWTGQGAKVLVDYLIENGNVIFCENKGFKLVKI